MDVNNTACVAMAFAIYEDVAGNLPAFSLPEKQIRKTQTGFSLLNPQGTSRFKIKQLKSCLVQRLDPGRTEPS